MSLGDALRVTLFGESHGLCVGALVEGIPAGTRIDIDALQDDIERRRPGRKGLSARAESDECEILSGVHEGLATGWPILLLTRNSDVRSSDYSFLPDHPRPGHADLPEMVRSGGAADLRGGGSQSARLTYGLVTAGSQLRGLLDAAGWRVDAHLHSVGEIVAEPLFGLDRDTALAEGSLMLRLNCRDAAVEEARAIIALDRETRSAAATLYEVTGVAGSTICQRRAACCLYFKGPRAQFGGTCPIIPPADRLIRNRAWANASATERVA